MNEKIRIMREERVPVALLKFGIPAIIGFLIIAVYNFVDAVFVGRLGTNAIGAVSVLFPLTFIMAGIGLLFGSGAASYISRMLGDENIIEVHRTAIIAVGGCLAAGTVIIGLLLWYMTPMLRFFGATDQILPYAEEYGGIFLIGSIFSILNLVLNHIARAEGAAKRSMVILVIGALLNIVLDPLFIFVLDHGIKGAAVATLVAQAVSTLLLLKFFLSSESVVKLSLRFFVLSKKIMRELLGIGIPYCIAQLLAGISMGLINSAAAPYGEEAVAAVGIANRVFAVGIYVILGFSKGFQPIAGYNYGARNYERLRASIRTASRWSTYCCILLAVIQIVFANGIVSMFTDEAGVITLGVKTLRAYSLVFPLFGYQVIYMTLFLTLGLAKKGFILSLGRQGIFLLPMIIILPGVMGLNGVIYAQPIADILTMMLTVWFTVRWKYSAVCWSRVNE